MLNSIGILPSSAGSAACRFLLTSTGFCEFFSPAEEIGAITDPLREQIHPVSSAGAVLEGCFGGILGEGQRRCLLILIMGNVIIMDVKC